MKNKILMAFLFVFLIIIISEIALADITTINPDTVNPGEEIRLTINPNRRDGFYNILYVLKEGEVVDAINVPCSTICTRRQRITYTVPQNFLGEYYFATFDYYVNDWELDYFNVLEPGGAPSGSLTIQYIRNIDGTNWIINPEQGKNANIETSIRLRTRNCQDYIVKAYICNSTLTECNENSYTYELPVQLTNSFFLWCFWGYQGEDYFPFYQPEDNWALHVKSGVLEDSHNFVYNSLAAINYSSYINFGALHANLWNVGAPEGGVNLSNAGNIPMLLAWNSSGFTCTSGECIGDFWPTFYNGENTFQIDDDNTFLEDPLNETGILPSFITDYELNYFPQNNLSVCISDHCNNSIGEKYTTFYNLKLHDIRRGLYQGDIRLTAYPPLDVEY